MSKTRRWLVLATVSAGLLMVSVGTTALYTALPTLTLLSAATGWSVRPGGLGVARQQRDG
jgi:hypothetical protein